MKQNNDIPRDQADKYRYHAHLRRLKVDLDEISMAMRTDRSMDRVFLDTQSGDIIQIPMELDEDRIDDEKHIAYLPQWEKDMVDLARAVYDDTEGRYEPIPEKLSSEDYDTMVMFVRRLDDINLAQRLYDALEGKGAFRRFKDTLARYPQTERDWYEYKDETERQEVRRWLWRIGIDPIED